MVLPVYFYEPLTWLQLTAIVGLLAIFYHFGIKPKKPNFRKPFSNDNRRPRIPLELHQTVRALRLEQPFSTDALPSEIDAIVIGSGIGGLATAAILAKTGRTVVVLEKHSKAGGSCQSFNVHGYEWDVGIHYVGHMGPSHFERFLLDQLTEGQLEWHKMDDDFDKVVLSKSPTERKIIPIWADRKRLLEDLIERYPQYEDGLRQFFDLVPCSASAFAYFAYLKVMPLWLAKMTTKLRLHTLFTNFFIDFNEVTVKQRLDHLFGNRQEDEEVKAVVGYCSGLANLEQSRMGAGLLAFAYDYYDGGAYYPVGGANEVPYSMIPTIEKAGGRVLVNANVTEIIVANNKAIGVRVGTSSGPVDVKAPIVVSDAGISNTFRRLLPKYVASRTTIGRLLGSGRIHPSLGMFQVFVGLKGSQAELKLPAKNLWLINDTDLDKAMTNWLSLDLEAAVYKAKIPYIFVSFPSARDPTYDERHPGRSVCYLLVSAPMKWFQKWEQDPLNNRSRDYQAAKLHLATRCWNLLLDLMPQLGEAKDFIDAATPLTTRHYLNAFNGECYGLDHDRDRYAPEVAIALRPEVPEIKQLYLTGQDVLSCGFTTCLYSALLTCESILKPLGECENLIEEAKRLFRDNPPREFATTTCGGAGKPLEMESSLGDMADEE